MPKTPSAKSSRVSSRSSKPSDNPDIIGVPSATAYSKGVATCPHMSELSACRDNGLWGGSAASAIERGSEEWRAVRVHQPGAHAAEAVILGRHGGVVLAKRLEQGPLFVARAEREAGEARPGT